MGKMNALQNQISQNIKLPVESALSILKEQKKKEDKELPSNLCKKKPRVSQKTSKRTSTKQNRKKKKKKIDNVINIFAPKDIKRLELTEYSKNNNEITNVWQEAQTKTKKKRNKKRKSDINLDQSNNNNLIKIDLPAVKRMKKLSISAKRIINFEENTVKTFNVKIGQKEKEQMSTERITEQAETEKILKLNNRRIKIKRLKEMLNNEAYTEQPVQNVQKVKKNESLTLRDRMMAKLKASRFRYINETLYNNDSSQSRQYFKDDPDAFKAYHNGYKQQLGQWPINPLDVIILSIKKMPTNNIIADFGCGEAQLAAFVPHEVYSFDFIAVNDRVKACDMAHTPLLMNSVHVVVFCLSLMGTNLNDYFIEANRVLKSNGILKIAEVESRFEDIEDFIKLLDHYGFKNTWKDLSHDLFYFMDFKKVKDVNTKRKNFPPITLKPCLYKKR